MVKIKNIFSCQECGAQSPRWVGKCNSCGAWNSYIEEKVSAKPAKETMRTALVDSDEPVLLQDVDAESKNRWITGLLEFDRVMGSGIVQGSVTLIGGDPGIGKSTLSLQIACHLSGQGKRVLYISGEESITQTKLRADRIGYEKDQELYIVNQIDLNVILEQIKKLKPHIVIVDSIQVVYQPELSSSPGSVSQVRECASLLTYLAKAQGIGLFIIGHVTKEGTIAGPRVLEHIVDTVLYFEGERYSTYRVLRTTKNRFGSTNELGVFEMTSDGLKEVSNPSEIFLAERAKDVSGSLVVPILEGTRPFLIEVQGLVSRSAYGVARHKAQGFDVNRLALLVAVLEKRLSLNLGDQDIFLNIVGGVKVMDPAADLGIVLAVASSFLDKPIDPQTVVIGEVGLSAEVRSVAHIAPRIVEAEKLGFKKCILPKNSLKGVAGIKTNGIEIIPVEHVREALDYLI